MELRQHDLSDGIFIPRIFSKPNVPSSLSTNTVQLRSADGATYIEIASGNVVNIHSSGGCNIVGPVNITGDLQVTGNVQGGAVVLNTHVHGGVQGGGGTTTGPI